MEDFRSRDHLWDLTRYAVDFFRGHLPFAEMAPADELTPRDDDYCLAKRGAIYALYLPETKPTEIELESGTYQVRWYNPRTGGELKLGSVKEVTGPGHPDLGAPPGDERQDWACLVTRKAAP